MGVSPLHNIHDTRPLNFVKCLILQFGVLKKIIAIFTTRNNSLKEHLVTL